MKYELAEDLQKRMEEAVRVLGMKHVDVERVICLRSRGSKTKRTLARCHALGKVMQLAIGTKAWYAIEFLEKFEGLDEKEQDKVIIHELMHIPQTFGGGFRHHDHVCEQNVEVMYARFEAAMLDEASSSAAPTSADEIKLELLDEGF